MRHALLAALLVLGVSVAPAGAEEVTLRYGPDQTPVELTIERPPGLDNTAGAPLIIALPPGPGTGRMVQAIVQNYLRQEAAARGYVVVSPAIFGPSLKTEAATFVPALFSWIDNQPEDRPLPHRPGRGEQRRTGRLHRGHGVSGSLRLRGDAAGRTERPGQTAGRFRG